MKNLIFISLFSGLALACFYSSNASANALGCVHTERYQGNGVVVQNRYKYVNLVNTCGSRVKVKMKHWFQTTDSGIRTRSSSIVINANCELFVLRGGFKLELISEEKSKRPLIPPSA